MESQQILKSQQILRRRQIVADALKAVDKEDDLKPIDAGWGAVWLLDAITKVADAWATTDDASPDSIDVFGRELATLLRIARAIELGAQDDALAAILCTACNVRYCGPCPAHGLSAMAMR